MSKPILFPTAETEDGDAEFVRYDTSDRDDVCILLWRRRRGNDYAADYYLTRFVWGHEDGSFRFDQRHEAYEAARICNRLCRINIIDKAGPPDDDELPF